MTRTERADRIAHRRRQKYLIHRHRWVEAMSHARGICEAGVATHKFVRAVVHGELHLRDGFYQPTPVLDLFADVCEAERAVNVIFGSAIDRGLVETYLDELAFADALRSDHLLISARYVGFLIKDRLVFSLFGAGFPLWAVAFKGNVYALAVPAFDGGDDA